MATAAAPESIVMSGESQNTIYSTVEIRALNLGERVGVINPIRRIATVDAQHVLKGAAQLHNPNKSNHTGMVEHLTWEGMQDGVITDEEVAQKGISVILGKVIENPSSLVEFHSVAAERKLAYLVTHQRRDLMKKALGEAYITFEFEMDFMGFYDRKGIDRRRGYEQGVMPDFQKWEFEGDDEAVLFGESFRTFLGSVDFDSRVGPAIVENAHQKATNPNFRLSREETVEASFGLFILNHIFNGFGEDKRDRKIALESLGLPQGLSAAQVDHDIIYAPIGAQIGKYLTNLDSGFIRTRHLAEMYYGR